MSVPATGPRPPPSCASCKPVAKATLASASRTINASKAAALANQGELEPALALLTQATQTAPTAPRPWLDLARLQHHQGATDAAWNSLLALAEQAPQALPLALPLLQDIAQASGQEAPAIALLRQRYAQTPSLDLVLALVQLQADPQGQAGQRCQQQDGTCSQGLAAAPPGARTLFGDCPPMAGHARGARHTAHSAASVGACQPPPNALPLRGLRL